MSCVSDSLSNIDGRINPMIDPSEMLMPPSAVDRARWLSLNQTLDTLLTELRKHTCPKAAKAEPKHTMPKE
jgi:hypothetical protein